MTKDKDLEELFSTAIMEFDDNDEFIDAVSENLDKLEFVREMQMRQKRYLRNCVITAFAAGAVSVALAFLISPYLPYDVQVLAPMLRLGKAIVASGQTKMISFVLFVFVSSVIICSVVSVLHSASKLVEVSKGFRS